VLDAGLAGFSVNDFYYLSRAVMVKNEQHFDRFDRVFAKVFKGLNLDTDDDEEIEIPAEWLEKLGMLTLTDEEKAEIEALGGWDKLMETLQQRLNEQEKRHEGGSKMIGTRGTSPFGAYGYNPEGVRIGQDGNRNFRAVKVWDRREFKDLDGTQELGTRNFKVALRRLRRFAREGAANELDLDDTIRSTARNAGWLDLRMVPERHNAVKVLLLLDVGGSMDSHIRTCETLFSAVRAEFKHLEHYYFHNCVYESVWRENRRRRTDASETIKLMHAYGSDYKLIFVGDAFMSPYEVNQPGGRKETRASPRSSVVTSMRPPCLPQPVTWMPAAGMSPSSRTRISSSPSTGSSMSGMVRRGERNSSSRAGTSGLSGTPAYSRYSASITPSPRAPTACRSVSWRRGGESRQKVR